MTEQNTETEYLERKMQRESTATDTEFEPVEQGRSLVVAIGINEYVHQQKLKNAVQDAIGLQQTLIDKLGFFAPISPLLNEAATKTAILSLIEDKLYEVVEENDSLIVFFAGHGTTRVRKVGNKEIETGYLVPVDATQSWSEYVEIDPFLRGLSALPARHILVILDSCESGLALGQAMQSFRDTTRYTKDLSSRFSRKVITSAQRDQLALDSGPISGHSLFTGTLVDGFNWGKADLDGNGLITSSELGLFIQQQVGQASESRQTPDFGSFHLDDRGEMVISLRNQSFDALKARAFSALQRCEFSQFTELVNMMDLTNPSHLSSLYLKYRIRFLENDIKSATQILGEFLDPVYQYHSRYALSIDIGGINVSKLRDTLNRLSDWWQILSIRQKTSEFPIEISVLKGSEIERLHNISERMLGEYKCYLVEFGHIFEFQLKNKSDLPLHIYLVEIDEDGCFEPITVWNDEEILINGLQPGEVKCTYPFRQQTVKGTSEFRFLVSYTRTRFLLFPAAPATRSAGLVEFIDTSDLNRIFMKSVRVSSVNAFDQ